MMQPGDETRLGRWRWSDAATHARQRILLVPVGSTEQHGPHLSLDTDTRIAVALANLIARERLVGHCVVAPAIPYGASGEHADFPGTLSIGHEALTSLLVELGRSADAFTGIVFVNGHGGNIRGLRDAAAMLRDEGRRALVWSWSTTGGDAHAGRTETSLLLAIAPELVDLDAAEPGRLDPITDLVDELRAGGVRAVSPNGVLGDPIGASAEEGRMLLERIGDQLASAVVAFAKPTDP